MKIELPYEARLIKHAVSGNVGEISWDVLGKFLKVGIRNLDNVNRANEYLNNGGTIFAIHNHPGTPDPLLMLQLVDSFLSDAKCKGYFGSSKFFDGRISDLGMMDYLYQNKDTEFWRVLQPNDEEGLRRLEEKNKKNKTNITLEDINGAATRDCIRMLNRNLPSVVLICPQGTREPVMMEPFDKVIRIVEKRKDKALFFPVHISGSGEILGKGQKIPRLNNRATLTALPLLSYDQLMQRSQILSISPSHAMMLDITAHSEPRYWGVHAPDIERLQMITGIQDPVRALNELDNLVAVNLRPPNISLN